MLLLECANCSYMVDVEETEIISKRFTNAMLSVVSLTKVSQMSTSLLSSFPTGITCLYVFYSPTRCASAKDY